MRAAYHPIPNAPERVKIWCPTCDGKGQHLFTSLRHTEDCLRCKGTGVLHYLEGIEYPGPVGFAPEFDLRPGRAV